MQQRGLVRIFSPASGNLEEVEVVVICSPVLTQPIEVNLYTATCLSADDNGAKRPQYNHFGCVSISHKMSTKLRVTSSNGRELHMFNKMLHFIVTDL